MKTITDQINEIKKSSCSVSEKKYMLIKLGLRPRDIEYLEFTGFFNSDKPLTFGVEIECYHVRYADVVNHQSDRFQFVWEGYNHTDRRGIFKFTTDCSIDGADPRECVTPILENNDNGFSSLKTCCDVLNSVGAMVNKSCGLHVHVGVEGIGQKGYVNIFKNYQKLESLIDSFMAPSRRNNGYCLPIRQYDFSHCESVDDVNRTMHYNRYHKVNPCAYSAHKTVEFRQHQGSTDYEKISMWVNFCCKLVQWSKDNVLMYNVTDINEVPFLNSEEKAFFAGRIAHFASAIAA